MDGSLYLYTSDLGTTLPPDLGTYTFTYRVVTINVSRKWIEWAEWAASLYTANSPFPGHVYCRHPVLYFVITENDHGRRGNVTASGKPIYHERREELNCNEG